MSITRVRRELDIQYIPTKTKSFGIQNNYSLQIVSVISDILIDTVFSINRKGKTLKKLILPPYLFLSFLL